MNRTLVLAGGVAAYAGFLAVFLYLTAFMAGLGVPKSIDSGGAGSLGWGVLINSLLLGLFAVQHAVMARDAFKARWTRIVPEPLERSTFVVAASLVLALLFWQWRAIPGEVWSVQSPPLRYALWCLFATGIGTVLYTSFLIDHFDLFGLRQVWLYFRGRPYTHVPFSARSLYKVVRHPMMVGFLLTLWCVPRMTWGHLQFSALMTAYILVGVHMEERSLSRKLGADYLRYRQGTPMLIPIPRRWRFWRASPTGTLLPEGQGS